MSAASARRSSRAHSHATVPRDAQDGASTPSSARGNKKPADFMFGATLGEGAYARVVHARMKETGAEYAIKIMEKRFIMKEKKVKFVMMERKVFTQLASERIVKLFYTFHDDNYLYMVMELCRGGELLDVITKHQKEQAARGVQDRGVFARAHTILHRRSRSGSRIPPLQGLHSSRSQAREHPAE
ncbi:hypothetical protein PINS_up021381 [Pythium insidiosum]|nr:hypothetical protein PINS_up021381 [Pythium insidiosum]